MELLDDEERALLEALLDYAVTSGRSDWHLLEVNAATRHLGLEHARRVSALSRLQGKGLLRSVRIDHIDGGHDCHHGIEPDRVRACLAPPKPPRPRGRLSALAG